MRNGLGGIQGKVGLLANKRNFPKDTHADFHVSKEFWASRLGAGGQPDIVETVSIPWRCLEDEITSFGANVIICDIEGGEVDLLAQADLSGVRLIILETHYWARGEKETDAMMRALILNGFSIHLENSGQGVSVLRRL